MPAKVFKTSVTLNRAQLRVWKREARRQRRSVSFLIREEIDRVMALPVEKRNRYLASLSYRRRTPWDEKR